MTTGGHRGGALRRVLASAMLLAGFRIAADLAQLLFYVALSRTFGAQGLGLYAYGMALTAAVFALPAYTLATCIIRSGSASHDSYARLWPAMVRLSALGLGAATLGVVLFACLLPTSEAVAILVIGSGQLFYYAAEIYRVPFAVSEQLGRIAFAELAYKGAIAAVGVGLMLGNAHFLLVLGAFPISGLVYFLLVRALSRPLQPVSGHAPAALLPALRAAAPFFAAIVVETPLYRQYPVLLSWLGSIAQAGLFGAAFKPVEAGLLCLAYLDMALLPTLTRMGASGGEAHARLFRQAVALAMAVALAGAATGILIAPGFIDLLFGPAFASAVPALRVLCAGMVAGSLKRLMLTRLIAVNLIARCTMVQLVTLLTGLGTGLLLVPLHGAVGAALALGAGEVAGCVAAAVFLRREPG